jgi:hypothetical protein
MLFYDIVDGDCIKISEHDKNFIYYQAQFDFRANKSLIMSRIAESYPSTPLLSLCVEIHYTSFSFQIVAPLMNVQLVSSHQWQDADEERDVQDLLRRAGTLDGDNLLLRAMVLDGHLVRPFRMICSLVPAVLL